MSVHVVVKMMPDGKIKYFPPPFKSRNGSSAGASRSTVIRFRGGRSVKLSRRETAELLKIAKKRLPVQQAGMDK